MTQEEKELLLKDLSARLPYGVKVHINSPIEEQNSMELFDVNFDSKHIGVGNEKWAFRAIPIVDDEDEAKVVKPYLRPMSSMTEEEKEKFEELFPSYSISIERTCIYHSKRGDFNLEVIDWLNKKMFAYRTIDGKDMFELGLALEAPEGMYK